MIYCYARSFSESRNITGYQNKCGIKFHESRAKILARSFGFYLDYAPLNILYAKLAYKAGKEYM